MTSALRAAARRLRAALKPPPPAYPFRTEAAARVLAVLRKRYAPHVRADADAPTPSQFSLLRDAIFEAGIAVGDLTPEDTALLRMALSDILQKREAHQNCAPDREA